MPGPRALLIFTSHPHLHASSKSFARSWDAAILPGSPMTCNQPDPLETAAMRVRQIHIDGFMHLWVLLHDWGGVLFEGLDLHLALSLWYSCMAPLWLMPPCSTDFMVGHYFMEQQLMALLFLPLTSLAGYSLHFTNELHFCEFFASYKFGLVSMELIMCDRPFCFFLFQVMLQQHA